ncbi:GNAT family N-acetyltransferase [Methylocystis sp. FS]|uniref:GNAT family N-acetyltransferase n=1 Tax=Methylocystis silviterrae TaxID=2743612 RepID=UPI001584073E|nr:GNAT family N-acetyltransferase [Methylocystis silviterrae]NUJ81752.1 GNAT family N-acetyltransferase [Methylocystis silviterrae]
MAAITPPRPLAESDDRSQFDCGRESLNNWFQRHAWPNHANDMSRVSVITDATTGRIVGYVALSAAQIERAYLPKAQQRNRPDPVPVLLLGQLAVDQAYQGRGYAVDLLHYALKTALRVSESVGSMGVIAHPLDDGVRGFYARWGFQELPFDPRRAMIVRMADLRANFSDKA